MSTYKTLLLGCALAALLGSSCNGCRGGGGGHTTGNTTGGTTHSSDQPINTNTPGAARMENRGNNNNAGRTQPQPINTNTPGAARTPPPKPPPGNVNGRGAARRSISVNKTGGTRAY